MSQALGRKGSIGKAARGPGRQADQPELRVSCATGRCGQGARKGKGMARSARRPGRQAQVTRLLLAGGAAGAALLLACASVGTPPGGPPDKEPPKILQVKPESGAVVPNWKSSVVIQYDGVIDEMPGSGSAGSMSGLAKQILLSPVRGPVKVDWHRSSISVKPKEAGSAASTGSRSCPASWTCAAIGATPPRRCCSRPAPKSGTRGSAGSR